MDIRAIKAGIKRVLNNHNRALRTLSSRETAILELATLTGIAEHYRSKGFSVQSINPGSGSAFVVKSSSNGHPWNFSHIECVKGKSVFELHLNLKVMSAHDQGIYCVDVAAVRSNRVPRVRSNDWAHLKNKDLLTFAETKKLNIYPMLLAQFFGIVHEIMPKRVKSKFPGKHLPPTLVSLGYYSANSSTIVQSYKTRGICINVAENFDHRLSEVARNLRVTPFGKLP